MKRLIAFLFGLGIGAGVVWFLIQPRIDEQEKKIRLLNDRILEWQTTYENDLNALREEYGLLYKNVQELRKTALTPEMKQKVECLFTELEQTYQSKEVEAKTPNMRYRV